MKHLTLFLVLFVLPLCFFAQEGDKEASENDQIISRDTVKPNVPKERMIQKKLKQKDSLQKPLISTYTSK